MSLETKIDTLTGTVSAVASAVARVEGLLGRDHCCKLDGCCSCDEEEYGCCYCDGVCTCKVCIDKEES